jgi:hypothetical protein
MQHRQLEISSAGSRPIYAGNARWTYSHQLTRAGARDGFLPFLLQLLRPGSATNLEAVVQLKASIQIA